MAAMSPAAELMGRVKLCSTGWLPVPLPASG